jgi:AraC family transcriptional regulator
MQSHYHITLRMDEAKRLLRETKKNVVSVALDVGYSNPSHFSQFFRREKAFRILLLRISTT